MPTNQPSFSNDPTSPLWVHGTDPTFKSGCRCVACCKAHKSWKARAKSQKGAAILANPTIAEHGKSATYTRYYCRCKPCVDDHKREMREYHANRKERESRWTLAAQTGNTPAGEGVNMNKNVISLLNAALMAVVEGDDVKAYDLTSDAVVELLASFENRVTSPVVPVPAKAAAASTTLGFSTPSGRKKRKSGARLGRVTPELAAAAVNRFLAGEGSKSIALALGMGQSTVGNIVADYKRNNGIPMDYRGRNKHRNQSPTV